MRLRGASCFYDTPKVSKLRMTLKLRTIRPGPAYGSINEEVSMKVVSTVALALVALFAFAASDVTGKWSGTLEIANPEGGSKSEPAFVILKADGATLTGSGGPNEADQKPIRNGKVQGDRLTFEIETSKVTMRFDLKVAENRIEGKIDGEGRDGEKRSARISLQRLVEK
jgi:hypothetical protein